MKPSAILPLLTLLGPSTATPYRRSLTHTPAELTHTAPSSIPGPTFPKPGSKASSKAALASLPESQKAGARLSGSNITSVSAVFVIPAAEMATSGPTADNENGLYQSSYWVGIDGVAAASCGGGGASLRGGVDTFWDSGTRSTGVWWEWYPSEGPTQFAGFAVAQGDVVRITATAGAGGTAGEVLVERLDGTGCEAEVLGSATQGFEGKTGAGEKLCLAEAGWVIEDYPLYERPEIPLALANFTEVRFERMRVGGKKVEEKGLEVFDIRLEEQGGRLTNCEVEKGKGSVDCKRIVENP